MSSILQLNDFIKLISGLSGYLAALASNAPEVTKTRNGEGRGCAICPVCRKAPSEWGELDAAWRLNGGHGTDAGVAFYQHGVGFETLAYYCGDCESVVQIPPTINVVWD